MDNSQVHRARILKAHADQSNGMLTLFFLPPYSPDLNPDEWVWKNVKHDNLGRASVKSEGELAKFATTALASLKKMPRNCDHSSAIPRSDISATSPPGVQKLISALDHGPKRAQCAAALARDQIMIHACYVSM